MSENVKLRQEMEKRIVRRLLNDAKKDGYSFNVNNGGDKPELDKPTADVKKVMAAMFATDEEHIVFYKNGKRVGWVYLIYGNGNSGMDVISDYTVNLESCMAGVDTMIAKYN